MIRLFTEKDLPAVTALWNASVEAGEVVYRAIDAEYYQNKFVNDPNYDPRFVFAAEEDGKVVGFIQGVAKKIMLNKETNQSSPGFLTCIFVDKAYRRRGIGKALVERLAEAFREAGKVTFSCSGDNPINIDWTIPGTPGHDHNNAPGMDTDSLGYPFLLAMGFKDVAREVAMYLDLSKYTPWDELDEKRRKLAEEGIYTGRYDVAMDCEFDGMCDRVGSEYWRSSLGTEIACHKQGVPNTDNRFIPNGRVPQGPRPILVATHEKSIVAFTGPVDKQLSGRGWFTGICTDPNFERRGIASVLFNLLMQEFIAEGAVFSTLFTGESNHAQRIYRRAGFLPVRSFVVMNKPL